MRVCWHVDLTTGAIEGVWWELPDDEIDCAYRDEVSITALMGHDMMTHRPKSMPWNDYWGWMARQTDFLFERWMVSDVDDESYGYELLYHPSTCHPQAVVDVQDPRRS